MIQPLYWSIDRLPGLKSQERELLESHGIINTQTLLNCANTAANRLALANQLGLNLKYINKWVALADLARIPGVGCQYCGLTLHSGIASVFQLTQTPFYRLHRQIVRLQVATTISLDKSPSLGDVKRWIEEANAIYQQIDNRKPS